MQRVRSRKWWVARVSTPALLLFALTSCASLPLPGLGSSAPAHAPRILASDEDDFSQLVAQLRSDLTRSNGRLLAAKAVITPKPVAPHQAPARPREGEFSVRARALFAPLNGSALTLLMPVIGVRPTDIEDSWGAPRDGGERAHHGIDIFAPKGTEVIAVADGVVSFIGDQPKGGHCLWLTNDTGAAFYYAHLDRWAAGLYEGMEVRAGELLGYVGNTGNAIHTASHLHFSVNQDDKRMNPYPLLTRSTTVARAHIHTEVGGGYLAGGSR